MGRAGQYVSYLASQLAQLRTPKGQSKCSVAVLGICADHNSSYLRGPAKAPKLIREALRCDSSNMATEAGREVRLTPIEEYVRVPDNQKLLAKEQEGYSGAAYNLIDLGDMEFDEEDVTDPKIFFDSIVEVCRLLNANNIRPVTLGGDHSITYPLFYGLATTPLLHIGHHDCGDTKGGEWFEVGDSDETGPPLPWIIHFDAHPDAYEDFQGNPMSHASPFARILESGLCGRLSQFGIRCMNPEQARFLEQYPQAEQHGMAELAFLSPQERSALVADGLSSPAAEGPKVASTSRLYLSVDLDCLDPAFAPGVSHHEPGGLSTRELLHLIQSIPRSNFMGADIVEYNPDRDKDGVTAMVAAKVLKEIIPKLSLRAGRPPVISASDSNKKQKLPWVF